MKYKKGDIVNIFTQTTSGIMLEGKAKLKKPVSDHGFLLMQERWEVSFLDSPRNFHNRNVVLPQFMDAMLKMAREDEAK